MYAESHCCLNDMPQGDRFDFYLLVITLSNFCLLILFTNYFSLTTCSISLSKERKPKRKCRISIHNVIITCIVEYLHSEIINTLQEFHKILLILCYIFSRNAYYDNRYENV